MTATEGVTDMEAESFEFRDLFVLDLANNHQGDVNHGLAVIKAMGEVIRGHGVRAALKFQFRQLETLIHPDWRTIGSKHAERFLSTALDRKQLETLLAEVRAQRLVTMCTPFDEGSVELIEAMGIEVIKVASCSAKDWPLLDKIAHAGRPVIFSTGGLALGDIDNLVSFFSHRGVDFAIMHCVSVYPTPAEDCRLDQIDVLRERYPGVTIGWSTHEDPDATAPVMVAYAKGARMFERHVGLATPTNTLNAYSSTPEQVDTWLGAHGLARRLCSVPGRAVPHPDEIASIESLQRGIYALEPISAGSAVSDAQVRFSMPWQPGQVPSSRWRSGAVALRDLQPGQAVMSTDLDIPESTDMLTIKEAVHEVKAMLNQARIVLNSDFTTEYSHHYGISRFREFGAVLISCINRQYCKKLVIQLPNQRHPKHFHKLKEETFQVLSGRLHIMVDGHHRVLDPGDTQVVMPGVWHSFWTETGVIFEEISTTSYPNDSVYADPEINGKTNGQRKTEVDHWGRFQLRPPSAAEAADR